MALAWTLQLFAIWSPAYVPLFDLPNHMARHYLESLQLAGRELPPFYAVEYRILPNLGADLVVPVLLTVVSPATACKLFLTLAVLLYWLGPALFLQQCVENRAQAWAASILLLPWSFTSHLFWGFLNYYSGVGLAFLALAHYLWLSRRERVSTTALVAHTALVALLFVWHLAAWFIYGVVMGCHLAWVIVCRWRATGNLGWARAAHLCLPLLSSLGLFVVYSLGNRGVNPSSAYDWGGWWRKVSSFFGLVRGYDPWWDLAAAGLWAAAVVACFGVPAIRSWGWPHLCAGVLLVLYLLLPFQLGSTADADSRVLPALLVCLVAVLAAQPVRRFRLAALLLAGCLVVRYGAIAVAWQRHSQRLEEHAASFVHFEPRSRVLPIILVPEMSPRYPEIQFVAWAVLDKEVFMPTLFALPDQHTLSLLPPYRHYARGHADAFDADRYEITSQTVQGHCDYVWLYNPMGKTIDLPETLERVYARNGLTVWRVR